MTALPTPGPGPDAAVGWVREHLGDLVDGPVRASERFRGGQQAADTALGTYDVTGYARRRSQVWPPSARGASALSPYIRYGLLPLPRVWADVRGPAADVRKFRDELLWQEYARHLYARVGRRLAEPLRYGPPVPRGRWPYEDRWPREMACMDLIVGELERDGWAVNQTRMWLASQWVVRTGGTLADGEDRLYRLLLDGSRAANRLGWQWSAGTATGKPYGFSRWQVEKRAPGVCRRCPLAAACPIEDWPDAGTPAALDDPDPRLRADPDPAATGGPPVVRSDGTPASVWVTAESLGDDDPALAAHPDLPAVFVFDERLLARLRLAGPRLVFLAETLADLAGRRPVEVLRGDPAALAGRAPATTYAPVPGWRSRAAAVGPVEVHPWPWLRRPHGGPAGSFTAWVRRT